MTEILKIRIWDWTTLSLNGEEKEISENITGI